jgi:thioesterase domain-containing protein
LGQNVGTLAVFDTPIPGRLTRAQWAQVLAERVLHQAKAYARLPPGQSVERLQALARGAWTGLATRVNPAAPLPLTWFDQVDQRNQELIRHYALGKIPTFPGRVTVVLAQRSSHAGVSPALDARRFWRYHAREGIDVREVQSNHLAMLEPGDVEALAYLLRDILRG